MTKNIIYRGHTLMTIASSVITILSHKTFYAMLEFFYLLHTIIV